MISIKKTGGFSPGRIFIRFLGTYVAVFLISLAITCVLYCSARGVMKQNAIDTALSMLTYSRDLLDAQLLEISYVVDRIVEDQRVASFVTVGTPMRDTDYERLRVLKSNLPYSYSKDTFIKNLYIYYPGSEVLLSPHFASGRIEMMYNYYLKYEGMDYPEWKNALTDRRPYASYWSPRNVSVAGETMSVVTYIQSIPNNMGIVPGGVVAALIAEDSLSRPMDNTQVQNGGISYVVNADGIRMAVNNYSGMNLGDDIPADIDHMLTDGGSFEISTSNGTMLVMCAASGYSEWKYVSVIPLKTVMETTDNITRAFVLIILAVFVAVMALAAYLAYCNSRPIHEMARTLGAVMNVDAEHSRSEYKFIQSGISGLIGQNARLAYELSRQEIFLRGIFFDRLLQNRFANRRELTRHMERAGLRLAHENYCVLLAHIEGVGGSENEAGIDGADNESGLGGANSENGSDGGENQKRVLAMAAMERQWGDAGYIHPVDEALIAVILGVPVGYDTADAVGGANTVKEQMDNLHVGMYFGVGRPRRAALALWESYNEAKLVLERIVNTSQAVGVYLAEDNGVEPEDLEYVYPVQVEMKLINLVKLGMLRDALDVLSTVCRQNTDAHTHGHTDGQERERSSRLTSELCGTAIKLRDELRLRDGAIAGEMEALQRAADERRPVEEAFDIAGRLFAMMCDAVRDKKHVKNERLRNDIMACIERDFADPGMCLQSVATRFNMSDKYLSRFFKEQTGVNFSICLENIRMNRAKALLETGGVRGNSITVAEVAKRAGYININTFYKAYKRIYGVNPGAHRQT